MNTPLPALAWPLGLGGLIPFLAGLSAMALGQAWAGFAMAAYGATILAFLGAVHWGLALAAADGVAVRQRLIGGVIPALVAWVALLLPLRLGFVVLAAGLVVLVIVETIAARRGLLPGAYLRLRWVLSTVAAGSLFAAASIS